MSIKINNLALMMVFTFLSITFTSSLYAGEPKEGTNAYLGDLPTMFHSHALKMTKLRDAYKKSENDEEKEKLKLERDAINKEFKETFDEYIKTEPLEGNELPFKVASNNLPFEVLGVKLKKVSTGTTYFEMQVKINQDIRKPDGELSQSTSIHFVGVDSEDNIIPNTWNWATTQCCNDLEAGFVSDAKGHWNANRIQLMKDFAYMRIMSKADYEKMKESQKNK